MATAPKTKKKPATKTTTPPKPAFRPSAFDARVMRNIARDITREPETIRKDIARLQKIQNAAVQSVNGLTAAAVKKGKLGTPEQLVSSPVALAQVRKSRDTFDAAALKIRELEIELAESESLRR